MIFIPNPLIHHSNFLIKQSNQRSPTPPAASRWFDPAQQPIIIITLFLSDSVPILLLLLKYNNNNIIQRLMSKVITITILYKCYRIIHHIYIYIHTYYNNIIYLQHKHTLKSTHTYAWYIQCNACVYMLCEWNNNCCTTIDLSNYSGSPEPTPTDPLTAPHRHSPTPLTRPTSGGWSS